MTDTGRGWDSPEAREAEREDLLRRADRVPDPEEAADLRQQAAELRPDAVVFIAGSFGLREVVIDTDPCGLCHGTDEIRTHNPEITDGLTEMLTPPHSRIWQTPCPLCRPGDFATWEPPS